MGTVSARASVTPSDGDKHKLSVSMYSASEIPYVDEVALRLTEAIAKFLAEYPQLFYRKQLDYGVGNISKFGVNGVLVRLSDKIERLINLLNNGRDASNESIEDTLKDIVGYVAILKLLLDGVWPEREG